MALVHKREVKFVASDIVPHFHMRVNINTHETK